MALAGPSFSDAPPWHCHADVKVQQTSRAEMALLYRDPRSGLTYTYRYNFSLRRPRDRAKRSPSLPKTCRKPCVEPCADPSINRICGRACCLPKNHPGVAHYCGDDSLHSSLTCSVNLGGSNHSFAQAGAALPRRPHRSHRLRFRPDADGARMVGCGNAAWAETPRRRQGRPQGADAAAG